MDADEETRVRELMTARLVALGLVTQYSAYLEQVLRSTFCSLVGSKYASVVAGGQAASWLIEQCEALVKANLELSPDQKRAIGEALADCRAAGERRNTLIHGEKSGSREDGSLRTYRSRRRTDQVQVEHWTPATIQEAAEALCLAAAKLGETMYQAVSPELISIDNALGWERRRRGEARTKS